MKFSALSEVQLNVGFANIQGHRYVGELDNAGKACGEGVVNYSWGGSYEGMFSDNQRQGLGKYKFLQSEKATLKYF